MSKPLTIGWHTQRQAAQRTGGPRYAVPLLRPHMIFSSGWRCGSTMLQRMLIAGLKDCVIWGEPWEEYEFHTTMMEQFLQASDVHHHITQTRPNLETLPYSQTANMNPGFTQLWQAHREFWLSLLWNRQFDTTNFGAKWVHADGTVLEYFKFLFPLLRPLILVRNPFDALESYMTAISGSGGWCRSRRKGQWILAPQEFLKEWYRMAESFEWLQGKAQSKDNWGELQVFRYEGFLDDGPEWSRLAGYVPELNMSKARLAQAYRVNHTRQPRKERYQVADKTRDWFLDQHPVIPFYENELRAP